MYNQILFSDPPTPWNSSTSTHWRSRSVSLRMTNYLTLIFTVASIALPQGVFPPSSRKPYSPNPLTPGYGISDYFGLMPDKVVNAQIIKAGMVNRHCPVVSASILRGRKLVIRADGVQTAHTFSVEIHTPAGRRVWGKDGLFLKGGNQSLILGIPHPLPKGIYLISVSGLGEKGKKACSKAGGVALIFSSTTYHTTG